MQKAVIVRTTLEDGQEICRSFDVDPVPGSPTHPLRRLLAAGWKVVSVCPMTNEIENACLLVLDRDQNNPRPTAKPDLSLVDMNHPTPWISIQSAPKGHDAAGKWDGQTIPLGIFRIDPAHVDDPNEKRPG